MVQIEIGSLPVQLVCVSNGTIALVPVVPSFPVYLDMGVPEALIDKEGLHIGESTFHYSTAYRYKEFPCLTAWLARQGLISPF